MAYVNVPKDLGKVKPKVAFNLTARQIVCFFIATVVGFGFYTISKNMNMDLRLYLTMAVVSPFIIAGVYEKDGISVETYLKYRYETQVKHPRTRIYSSKNLYLQILEEGDENKGDKSSEKKKQ